MDVIVEGVTKVYGGGVRALDAIDLRVRRGTFGLLGPNGAGKTTLLRILVTLIRPSDGAVTIGGYRLRDASGRAAVKRQLGYLPQDLGVYPDLTAEEMVDYMAILKGMRAPLARRRRVAEVLAMVNLTADARRKLRTFSGGMRQRVGLAQALVNDPQLLIIDEPTAGLDPEERIRLRTLLVQLGRDRTVLLSTHIVEDIAQVCQTLAVQARGRIIFMGTTQELVRAASGSVWSMTGDAGASAPEGMDVVGMTPTEAGVRYRMVGQPAPRDRSRVQQVDPTLEDGYVWLLHRGGADPRPVAGQTASGSAGVHSVEG